MKLGRLGALIALVGFVGGGNAWAAVSADLKALVEQGESRQAYELGKQHQDQLGDPVFDFYFGVAAVNSGRAGEGVLALERYVANMPQDAYGRLELARGYFVLGEDARARQEFLLVLEANPPPDVRANVERFLDALRSREALYRPATGFFVEAGFGHDSNVNAGVASGTMFRLFGVDLLVPDTAVARRDWYSTFAAAYHRSVPIRPGMIVFGAASADLRKHFSAEEFDQVNVRFDGGMTFIQARDLWRASVSYNTLYLENDRFREAWTLSGEWHHQLDELQTVNAFLQLSRLSYTGANSLRDSSFPILGLGYRRAFISAMQPLFSVTTYIGKEDVRADLRSDLSRDVFGLRVTGSVTPAPRWSLLLGASYQESDYRGPDLVRALDFTRKDYYSAIDVTVSYAINKNLSVRGEALLSSNSSNDALFDHKRDGVSFKIRYDGK